jgi:hypothetical protein
MKAASKLPLLDLSFHGYHHWPLLEKNRKIAEYRYLWEKEHKLLLLDLSFHGYHHWPLLEKNRKIAE